MKTFSIIVNAEKKQWAEHDISYEQVVQLAFPNPPAGLVITYTVEYERAANQKHEGSLVKGQSVHINEGMIFSVTETGRS